jgi:hypothetical protein
MPVAAPARRPGLSLALSSVVTLTITVGCGGTQLDRLEGDPPSTHAYTTPATDRVHPAVDGVQRFLAAMKAGNLDAAFRQLSRDTRQALDDRAAKANLTGTDLLRLGKMPVGNSLQGALPFDPIAVFVVPDVETFQVVPTPADANEQRLNVTGKGGRARELVLKFEGYGWRIHQPALPFPEQP